MKIDFASLSQTEVLMFLCEERKWNGSWGHFKSLVYDYNYQPIALLTYIDNLMTYEALTNPSSIIQEIFDYVRMMAFISPKYDKYPKNFLTTHKIAIRNYNRLKTQFDEMAYVKQINKQLEYSYNQYIITYPDSTQAIKDEAVQQNHCVASYIDRVINGTCDILFMRLKEKPDESLITLEIRNGSVVQARGKFNRETNEQEKVVVEKYNKYLEKIKLKNTKEIAC